MTAVQGFFSHRLKITINIPPFETCVLLLRLREYELGEK